MYKYRVHYVIDGKTEDGLLYQKRGVLLSEDALTEDSFKDFDWFTDDMKIVGLANEKVV